MSSPDFDTPDLARAVERLSVEDIHRLPYGAVHLDRHGIVTLFSRGEAELSGFDPARALGMSFFREVAPCMNTPMLRGRIDEAMARGTFDAEFSHVGDFSDADRELSIRAQSAADGGVWLFLKRFDA